MANQFTFELRIDGQSDWQKRIEADLQSKFPDSQITVTKTGLLGAIPSGKNDRGKVRIGYVATNFILLLR